MTERRTHSKARKLRKNRTANTRTATGKNNRGALYQVYTWYLIVIASILLKNFIDVKLYVPLIILCGFGGMVCVLSYFLRELRELTEMEARLVADIREFRARHRDSAS